MTYKGWIEAQRHKWIGTIVKYQGKKYNVVFVDYNGALIINKPSGMTCTTAVWEQMVTVVRR